MNHNVTPSLPLSGVFLIFASSACFLEELNFSQLNELIECWAPFKCHYKLDKMNTGMNGPRTRICFFQTFKVFSAQAEKKIKFCSEQRQRKKVGNEMNHSTKRGRGTERDKWQNFRIIKKSWKKETASSSC